MTNAGNYLCWGGKKFVPDIPQKRFLQFLNAQPIFQYSGLKSYIWEKIAKEVFTFEPPYGEIGLSSEKAGLSPYYSSDLKKKEILRIDKHIRELGID